MDKFTIMDSHRRWTRATWESALGLANNLIRRQHADVRISYLEAGYIVLCKVQLETGLEITVRAAKS